MAAGFAIASANVEGPGGALYPKVAVLLRRNTLRIKAKGVAEPVVEDDTVILAERLGRKQWRVTTAAGQYVMTKEKCACGGG